MPTSSNSATNFDSPIGNIPYDVLREIFLHCLPHNPHEWRNRQPSTKIAPILLCHVCSSWRTVALTSPKLWTHIGYYFPAEWTRIKSGSDRYWAIRPKDLEFIQWWRKNHGAIPPFLSFTTEADQLEVQDIAEAPISDLPKKSKMFAAVQKLRACQACLLLYMASAQCLDISMPFWNMILRSGERNQWPMFPNLHTLTSSWNLYDPLSIVHDDFIGLLPHCSPMLLRRLHIHFADFGDWPTILPHLHKLTHISLQRVGFNLEFWHVFIRAFPDLQWASFDIYIDPSGLADYFFPPPKHTLSHLTTLYFSIFTEYDQIDTFTPFFDNLSLPSVHTLGVSSDLRSWMDQRAIAEISTVLQSAPNITTLYLGRDFLSEYHLTADIIPFWQTVSNLTRLQLQIFSNNDFTAEEVQMALDQFVGRFFNSETEHMLFDLKNVACSIRTISLALKYVEKIEDRVASHVRDLKRRWPNIDFQICSESLGEASRDAWESWIL
ncbi:hypothetical protein BDN70DRAFT_700791 [Pholiota conissans]|uniref:F-box domain-containing protein n=1 Tax=Pholiota conissans TaxID=109636 RepID=A0A9P5Z0M4_9AGAR|nr:hypothetical protein BDN70DRAFT_700791 [Pholiota conissans]